MFLVQRKCPFKQLMFAFILSSTLMVIWIYSQGKTLHLLSYYNKQRSERREQPTVSPQCGSGRIVRKGEMVRVNGTKTLLISAYQDHQEEPKAVRIIAVGLRSESVSYHCLFCCQDQLHISKGVNWVLDTHYSFAYGTAYIMCPIPTGCQMPSHIAVISSAAEFNEDSLSKFLEVKNQELRTDSFPYNFVVCVSTMFEFDNVLQLVQTLEMLKLLGVNRVVIYKTSCSPETQRILDYYTHKGFMEVIPWTVSRFLNVSRSWLPGISAGDIHYFGQIPALNDCLYRYMYQTKYLAMHDLDELILPQSVSSWLELFPLLEKQHGAGQCYSFENNVFPNNIIRPPPGSQTLAPESLWCPGSQYVPGVNILAHLYQEPPKDVHYKRKLIVNPRGVNSLDVHFLSHAKISCNNVDRNVGRMYHTRAPLQPELTVDKLIYDDRLLNYSSHLMPAVLSVLTESGLLPQRRKL